MTSIRREPLLFDSMKREIEHGVELLRSQGVEPTKLSISRNRFNRFCREAVDLCGMEISPGEPATFMGMAIWWMLVPGIMIE